MSTYKDRKTWWISIRHNNVRYRKRSPENSKAGASAYEAVLRQKLARGESLEDETKKSLMPTFKEFAERWYDVYVKINNKFSEQRNKRLVLSGQLIPFFGSTPLDEIKNFKIEQYKVAARSRGLAPKTINNQLGILAKCLRDANSWGILGAVPEIKKLRVPPSKFDFLTPFESKKLLDAAGNTFWYTMILIALETGLRLSELKGLKWEDIDLERQMLVVRRGVVRDVVDSPKSNRIRHIPLSETLVRTLSKWPLKIGWVFSLKNGKPMQHGAPEKAMRRIWMAAGLRKIGWHVLRHTFASHLVARGANLKAVQELLGHADIQTTMRYSHLAPSELRATIDLLGSKKEYMATQNVKNCQQVDSNTCNATL